MKLLFISHRLPYPPNKGDKIRSFNILRHLSESCEIFLATHADDPEDVKHLPALRSITRELRCGLINSRLAKLRGGLKLLAQSQPISVSYFYLREVQKWIDDLLDRVDIDAIYCYSSPTAEYIFRSRHYRGKMRNVRRIMDLIDVDSYKWSQYAERTGGPMRIVYGLEAKRLREYERRIADEFDRLLLVSETENALFMKQTPTSKSMALSNGVDLDFFSPSSLSPAQASDDAPVLVFTGAMDYWPNVEGAEWFARNVLPRVQVVYPGAVFYIVGSRPTSAIQRLARECCGVHVTGYVEDIRPFIASANLCVIPLRIARGIQNKVLEAMAMGKAAVCTPQALEGIGAECGREVMAANDANAFASIILELLKDNSRCESIGREARAFVENKYSWSRSLASLNSFLASA